MFGIDLLARQHTPLRQGFIRTSQLGVTGTMVVGTISTCIMILLG